MNFTSIDVETANQNRSSICQIGVVQFVDGVEANRWSSLLNPVEKFSPYNVKIHGITAELVATAPTFPDIRETLHSFLADSIVVSHSSFDQTAIQSVHEKYGFETPKLCWLDSMKVAMNVWTDKVSSGYGLKPLTEMLGIDFTHHDAVEDARACGEVLIRAIQETGVAISDWIEKLSETITIFEGDSESTITERKRSYSQLRITRTANPAGPLAGEVVVFTGELSFPRELAADLACHVGCQVDANVTKRTSLLVVGDQDTPRRSSKEKKAEEYISKGQRIQILGEFDFLTLLQANGIDFSDSEDES